MTNQLILSVEDVAYLSEAIRAIGSAEFPALFVNLCKSIASADAAHLSAFFTNARPAEIYSTRAEPEALEALSLYLDVGFVLDPFYQLFLTAPADRVDSLADIAPDDFRRSEYYAKFFRALDLSDECGLMLPFGNEAALFLSVGVQSQTKMDLSALKTVLPLISALARRHWMVLTPDRFDGTGRLAAQLDAAFVSFGSSVLSPREGEITRMILHGYSSKAIAITFANSPETIKVHRKRIYAKLNVSSQGELLSLFLDALRRSPAGAPGDPLSYLRP
ncbi:MAG: helix-turn-helix transcriptional regulator [Pseudomonadota bacterium]